MAAPEPEPQMPSPGGNDQLQTRDMNQTGTLEVVEVRGDDHHTLALLLWLLLTPSVLMGTLLVLSWSWFTALIAVLIGFIFFRHFTLRYERPGPLPASASTSQDGSRPRSNSSSPVPDTSSLPAVYFLYVLGSGGHSAELIDTITTQFRGQPNQHRRYVITSGDSSSLGMAERLEARISKAYPNNSAGTVDIFKIRRARDVHQSLLTSPWTCLVSAGHAISALTREPTARSAKRFGYQFKYPHVIVTNGPASGFIVSLVAHVLKVFYLVPRNRLKVVYIESWARSRTLSLTGKLFLWTGIADKFCVQHERLARITGGEYLPRVGFGIKPALPG